MSHADEKSAIIALIRQCGASEVQADEWYRTHRLAALGGTCEAMVEQGHAEAVKAEIERIAIGGFA